MKKQLIKIALIILVFIIIAGCFFQCRYDNVTRQFIDEINENPQSMLSHIMYEQLPIKCKSSITKDEYMTLSTNKELLDFYTSLDKATDLSYISLTPSYYTTFSGRTPLSTVLTVDGVQYTILHFIEAMPPSMFSNIPTIKSWRVSITTTSCSKNNESEVEFFDLNYLGEFRPEMKIDGKIFYWDGLSYKFSGPDFISDKVVTIANGETYLPDNYSEYSNIASVTSSDVIGDCQFKASFDAIGVIYTSETTTEAIYILMSTDWFENKYVRFISSELMDCCICLNGNHYKIDIGNNQIEKELPDSYQSVGVLHFIGIDDIPSNNLETNCIRDTYSYSMEGREVFIDPENIEYLYVYEKQYWAQGEYDGYLKCPIMPSDNRP